MNLILEPDEFERNGGVEEQLRYFEKGWKNLGKWR